MKNNLTFRRTETDWMTGCSDRSLTYWRSVARGIFARMGDVSEIEIVRSGRKTDSDFVSKGSRYCAAGQYSIIASTGGKWGKSRRDFQPVTVALNKW